MMGCSLADSLRMATENPGRLVGGLGRLRIGAPADLVRFTIENGGENGSESGGTALKIASVMVKGLEWQ